MRKISDKQLLKLAEAISRDHDSKAVLDYRPKKYGLLIPWLFLWSDDLLIISKTLRGIPWLVKPVCFDEFYLAIVIPQDYYKV